MYSFNITAIRNIAIASAPLLIIFLSFILFGFHLSADGVEHLRLTLDNGSFLSPHPQRMYGDFLIQWPILFYQIVSLDGELDIYLLLYAIGIMFPLVIPIVVISVEKKLHDNCSYYCFIYVIGIALFSMSSSYVWTSHQTLFPLIFSLILLLNFYSELRYIAKIILILLLFFLIKNYETAFVAKVVLLFLLPFYIHPFKDIKNTLFYFVCVILLISGVISDSERLIFNQSTVPGITKDELLNFLRNNKIFLLFCIICLYFILQNTVKIISEKLALSAAVITFIVFVLFFIFDSRQKMTSEISSAYFFARYLTVGIVFFCLFFINSLVLPVKISSKYLFGIVTISVFAFLLFALSPWVTYVEKFYKIKQNNCVGFIEQPGELINDPASWLWNVPELSVALQSLNSSKKIDFIVLNQSNIKWEPFNPRENLPFFKNVVYSKDFYDKTH